MAPKFRIGFRTVGVWGNILLGCALVLGIFICVEIIAFNHNEAVDLTPGKDYTLSDQAKQILDSLDSAVTMRTFYTTGERKQYATFYEILQTYTPKIEYELIDLERNPGKARMYQATSPGYTIVEYKNRTHVINPPTEETVVNALIRLTGTRQKTFYVLEGHRERKDFEKLKEVLAREHWAVLPAVLSEIADGPLPDNTVLMVAGPESDFSETDIRLFDRYLKKGGKAIVMVEPFVDLPNLYAYLAGYRIGLPDAIIIDHKNKLFGGDYLAPLIPHYANAPITNQIRMPSFFSTARPLEGLTSGPFAGISLMVLATSEAHSWTEADRKDVLNGKIEYQEGIDRPGPLPVAAMATVSKAAGKDRSAGTELVCFGDSDFASDDFFDVMGNQDLILNVSEWLARDYDLISIRQQRLGFPYQFLTNFQGRVLFQVSVIVLPAVFLITGILLAIFRRVRG
ncbi:MAG: Gldg family protein [Desulfobacterales bacterium]